MLIETLASYVPAVVLNNVPAHSLNEPFGERFAAAVLFADISGFSALTEHLVQSGPGGIEELSIVVNAYFGQLIDLVIAHGGDIVEFTGDGIIALWPTPLLQEDMATVTRRAAQCGLVAQQLLASYEPAPGIRLLLRIGIGAGPVLVTTVGGVLGRWELLVAGQPLGQASTAQTQAQPGDVVLSPEAWSAIHQWSIGYPVGYACPLSLDSPSPPVPPASPDEHVEHYVEHYCELPRWGIRLEDVRSYLTPRTIPRIPLEPEMLPAIQAYLPAALVRRLESGSIDWVGELRNVTVLFVNIIGLDYDAPDILNRLQETIEILQTNLYHYEGSLNQFIVDDKGTLLIAAMGLPPLTHEDDAIRAIQFALDLQIQLREAGLLGSIGITTGPIFCGSRGSSQRRDYAMIGSVMNLAARLMQAAPDDVLCDESTYLAARTTLTFDELPPITVKGKRQPVAIYRPHREPPAAFCHLTTMVGRTDERTVLLERLRALRGEQVGSVIVIEGDAGTGKTRLADYLLQQAQSMNVVCLKGQCDAIERARPYRIWRSVFWQLFHLDQEPDDGSVWQKRVLDALSQDDDMVRFAPLLNAVLPIHLPPNDITRSLSPQAREENTRNLLLGVLWLMTRWQPTLIVLENANLMDADSWALTMAVSTYLPSLVLVITTRPLTDPDQATNLLRGSLEFEIAQTRSISPTIAESRFWGESGLATRLEQEGHPLPPQRSGGGDEYRLLLNHPGACRLVLKNFSYEETFRFVSVLLEVTQIPSHVVSFIYEKSQGNPLFIRELTSALQETGKIRVDQGICTVTTGRLHTLEFPETIQGVILSRIDRLPQGQQLTLKVASAIGVTFPLSLLTAIYPIPEERDAIPEHLRRFVQIGIIHPVASGPEPTYAFTTRITQEIISHTLLLTQRSELHRAVAAWYEQHPSPIIPPLL